MSDDKGIFGMGGESGDYIHGLKIKELNNPLGRLLIADPILHGDINPIGQTTPATQSHMPSWQRKADSSANQIAPWIAAAIATMGGSAAGEAGAGGAGAGAGGAGAAGGEAGGYGLGEAYGGLAAPEAGGGATAAGGGGGSVGGAAAGSGEMVGSGGASMPAATPEAGTSMPSAIPESGDPTTVPSYGDSSTSSSGTNWNQYAQLGSNMMKTMGQQRQQPQSRSQTPNLEAGMQNSQQPQFFDPNGSNNRGNYDLMLKLADLGAKENVIKQQMALAEELRKTPAPDMRQNGRVMVAAHPLEHLNTGVRQGLGYYERGKGMQAQTDMANEIRRRIQEERELQRGTGGVGNTTYPGAPDMMTIPTYEEA